MATTDYPTPDSDGMSSPRPGLERMKSMHQVHFDNWVGNDAHFEPRGGNSVVEIRESTEQGGAVGMRECAVSDAELAAWLACDDATAPGPWTLPEKGWSADGPLRFRLIHISPRQERRSAIPVTVPAESFRRLFEVLKVPPVFLRVFSAGLQMALPFDPMLGEGSEGALGLILRTDAFSFVHYSCCIVYDPRTRCTTCLFIGLRPVEYSKFLEYLSGSAHLCYSPMFLPIVLIDFVRQSTAEWIKWNRLSLRGIARSKELDVQERLDHRGLKSDALLDLDSASRQLTFMNDELGLSESAVKTHLRFLDTIEDIFQERRGLALTSKDEYEAKATESLRSELPFLRESFKSAFQYIARDKNNMQGLVQTTYCLIAQRESRQNLVIANASKQIAMQGRRDSADVRIITAITLIFLPGTFTATLLGSNLFDFRSPDDTGIAAAYGWIYAVVTILLTGMVLAGWAVMSRFQSDKSQRDFNEIEMTIWNQPEAKRQVKGFWSSRSGSEIWSGFQGDRSWYMLGPT